MYMIAMMKVKLHVRISAAEKDDLNATDEVLDVRSRVEMCGVGWRCVE